MTTRASLLRAGTAVGLAGWLAVGAVAIPAHADKSSLRAKTATLSVLHAIPAGVGAVDVYADRRKVATDLSPGQLRTTQIPAGVYDVSIVPAGDPPSSLSSLLAMENAPIAAGADMTIAAHLDSRGQPDLTVFTNKTRTVGMGMGRLTVRQLADAPRVDVRTRGTLMFDALANGDEMETGLRAGSYTLRISQSGERSPLMAKTTAGIRNEAGRSDMGNNVIVYVWGAAEDGRLRTAIQEVQLDLT